MIRKRPLPTALAALLAEIRPPEQEMDGTADPLPTDTAAGPLPQDTDCFAVDPIAKYRCQVCDAACDSKTWVFCVGTNPGGSAYVRTYCGADHAKQAGDWMR